jgi:hypothetical protein
MEESESVSADLKYLALKTICYLTGSEIAGGCNESFFAVFDCNESFGAVFSPDRMITPLGCGWLSLTLT